ncbi:MULTISPECIES: murein L,D-transpeptidase catalytic domain family protein [Sphingobacterium]|uniref:murein L,D-transpeptidase catalytic domain family protein n=1 Tax=Sphingobacterium TaxID=28453 RepID=UPI00097EBFD3|nr:MULTISPECIES: murein L,D-transpeptidase catalytic domain family protein [Sphingobacterium]SJN15593.1 hypothetical protein FM107_00025 [Sphingobacterium sp. JB170]
MRSMIFVLLTCFLVSYIPTGITDPSVAEAANSKPSEEIKKIEKKSTANILYENMKLAGVLNFDAFEQALQGYEQLNPSKKNILTVIDFTLPSSEKRMVVIDMDNQKVLFHNIVSHGKNSGEKYATSFSNKHGSLQSSLGFFFTEGTYQGGNGYSLILNGLEKGINDQAKARAVVIHGADYCSESFIKSTGRLGRSYGCPALPRALTKPIINTIKNGSLVYIYADNDQYLANTNIVKQVTSKGLLAQHDQTDSLSNLN